MNDLTALATKLAALIAEDAVFAPGGARVISQGGAPPAMVAILREVDDTVLERTLVFGLGDVTVSMVVAGRRLRGIVEVEGDAPGVDAVIDQVLTRDAPDVLKSAGKMLTTLADAATQITVRSTPVRPIGSSGDAGLSATGLAKEWGVDMDARPAPPMERFLAANTDAIRSMIYLEAGKVVEAVGDDAPLQAIWDEQIADFRKRHKALKAATEGPMLVCLDGALDGSAGAALAMIDDEACVFSYDEAALPTIVGSWSAITA